MKHILGLLLIANTISIQLMAQQRVPSWQAKAEKAYASIRYSDAVNAYLSGYNLTSKSAAGAQKLTSIAAKIADCYWLLRKYDSAYAWYAKLPASYFASDAKSRIRLADLLATQGLYPKAAETLTGLAGFEQKSSGFKRIGEMLSDSSDWMLQFAETINTPVYREFSPTITDIGLIWTTNMPEKGSKKGLMGWDNNNYTRLMLMPDMGSISFTPLPGKDAFQSSGMVGSPKRVAQNYDLSDFERMRRVTVPENAKAKVEALRSVASSLQVSGGLSYNQAHTTYNPATKEIYFSANRQEKLKNKVRTVGLVSASLQSASASNAQFLFSDGVDHSLMHPAIHPSGNQLVFSSDRKGGKGGFDLYVSTKSASGQWTEPSPVASCNTAGNEMFPTFGPDGKLYFSSDGMAGLGCLDIYVGTFQNGSVKDIKHLPYPVNSPYDDFGMAVMADGKSGLFSSDRYGTDDIFKYTYEKKTVKAEGSVLSEATGKGKPGVSVVLERKSDNQSYEQVEVVKTDANGNYAFQARPSRPYRVVVTDGENKVSQEFVTGSYGSMPFKIPNMVVKDGTQPVEVKADTQPEASDFEAEDFVVNFDFNSARIRSVDKPVLEKVKQLMDSNNDAVALLSGHTDIIGSDQYNLRLSRSRALAVKKYLQAMGVNASRVNVEYFGERKPVADVADKKEAIINRRVEIRVSKK